MNRQDVAPYPPRIVKPQACCSGQQAEPILILSTWGASTREPYFFPQKRDIHSFVSPALFFSLKRKHHHASGGRERLRLTPSIVFELHIHITCLIALPLPSGLSPTFGVSLPSACSQEGLIPVPQVQPLCILRVLVPHFLPRF